MIMSNPASLPPGFRFHPTDEELILHYLRNRAASAPCSVSIIADVDIYKFDPWDLPSMALYGDREWYFFSPRDRKYPNGIRPNRAAGSGYWKATGTDKPIHNSVSNENIGVKKALVFYRGRPPKGTKTNWIMHEYRLADAQAAGSSSYKPMKFRNASMRLDDWVLCRIYKKSSHVSPMAPPLSDHEQDEPCSFEDNMLAPSSAMLVQAMSTPTGAFHPHGASTQRALPKIPSISELLDEYTLAQLLDGGSAAAPEMARPEHPPGTTLLGDPAMNQLLLPNNIAQLHQMDASASPAAGEGSGKRKCSGEGGNAALLGHPPAKKPNGSCFGATLAAQGSLGQVPGLSHQLLLRSNLGMN